MVLTQYTVPLYTLFRFLSFSRKDESCQTPEIREEEEDTEETASSLAGPRAGRELVSEDHVTKRK